MDEEKKLVLLSFGEERIGGAETLRNESEEKSFREMLTPHNQSRGQAKKERK